jgi:hypothetical protein
MAFVNRQKPNAAPTKFEILRQTYCAYIVLHLVANRDLNPSL